MAQHQVYWAGDEGRPVRLEKRSINMQSRAEESLPVLQKHLTSIRSEAFYNINTYHHAQYPELLKPMAFRKEKLPEKKFCKLLTAVVFQTGRQERRAGLKKKSLLF